MADKLDVKQGTLALMRPVTHPRDLGIHGWVAGTANDRGADPGGAAMDGL